MPRPGFEPGTPRSNRGVIGPFHHQGVERKEWELNPPPPVAGRRGLADRSGEPISGSLPLRVDPPGIEPGLPPCHSGVIPLDHRPVSGVAGS
jgi:hypothetical protein